MPTYGYFYLTRCDPRLNPERKECCQTNDSPLTFNFVCNKTEPFSSGYLTRDGYTQTPAQVNRIKERGLDSASSKSYSHCISFIHPNINTYQKLVLHTKCLQSHPRWMTENREFIGMYPLCMLFLPGTHDSGSYDSNYTYSEMGEDILKKSVVTQVSFNTTLYKSY